MVSTTVAAASDSRDLTPAFFRCVRTLVGQSGQSQVKLGKEPANSPFNEVGRLLAEMKLVEQRHKLDKLRDTEKTDATNWKQVMSYFNGKAVGLLSNIEFESRAHHECVAVASKLFEAKMATFVKAYRDQQMQKLKQRARAPAKPIIPVAASDQNI